MVVHKEIEQVKQLVNKLALTKPTFIEEQTKKFRLWGWFEEVFTSDSLQIRKVQVYPEKKLTLQLHNECSEHWVITEGVADVLVEGREKSLIVGQSISVPAGQKHKLSNNQSYPLTLIETRLGSHADDRTMRFD